MVHRPIDGERVSYAWFPLLHDIRRIDRVPFNVNEGRRTMARQAELVKEKGLWHPTLNPDGAARPSATAPHIREGRADHAIDFNNAAGVIRAARKRGVRLTLPMPTNEPWHVEAVLADLLAYNKRRKKKVAKLRHAVKRAANRLAAAKKTYRKWRLP